MGREKVSGREKQSIVHLLLSTVSLNAYTSTEELNTWFWERPTNNWHKKEGIRT